MDGLNWAGGRAIRAKYGRASQGLSPTIAATVGCQLAGCQFQSFLPTFTVAIFEHLRHTSDNPWTVL